MSTRKTVLTITAALIAAAGLATLSSCSQANAGNSNTSSNLNEPANVEQNTNTSNSRAASHEIAKVSYSFNYAEVGDGWSYELVRGDNGKDTLYLTQIAYKKSDPNEFDLDHATLEKIEGICEEGGVYNWPEKLGKPDEARPQPAA